MSQLLFGCWRDEQAQVRSINRKPWLHEFGVKMSEEDARACAYVCPSDAHNGFSKPLHRRRVFLNHFCDWLSLKVEPSLRAVMFQSIIDTPNCDFILCTKQPGNFPLVIQETLKKTKLGTELDQALHDWLHGKPLPNVIILFSAGRQCYYDERLPLALNIPALVHGVSAVPLLEPINFRLNKYPNLADDKTTAELLKWIIVGGESGKGEICPLCKESRKVSHPPAYPNFRAKPDVKCLRCNGSGLIHQPRPCFLEWLFEARLQVQSMTPHVPLFIKQLGSLALFENADFWKFRDKDMISSHPITTKLGLAAGGRLLTKHTKGGNFSEFPQELRLQEFYAPIRR